MLFKLPRDSVHDTLNDSSQFELIKYSRDNHSENAEISIINKYQLLIFKDYVSCIIASGILAFLYQAHFFPVIDSTPRTYKFPKL